MRTNQVKSLLNRDDGSLGLLLMIWGYRIVLMLLMMAGICKFSVMPIKLMSTDCIIVMLSFAVLTVVLQEIYHACAVGRAHVSELVMSQVLANLISTAMIYLGVSLYVHKLFNPLPMIVVMTLQNMLGMGWSMIANHFYFKRRRKPDTAVIFDSELRLNKLYETPYFDTKYNVCKLIKNPSDDIHLLREQIADCEVVFSLGIPATLTNGISKLCLEMGIKGYFMPHLGHIIISGAEYVSTFSVPMLRVQRAGGHSEYRLVKRIFDVLHRHWESS